MGCGTSAAGKGVGSFLRGVSGGKGGMLGFKVKGRGRERREEKVEGGQYNALYEVWEVWIASGCRKGRDSPQHTCTHAHTWHTRPQTTRPSPRVQVPVLRAQPRRTHDRHDVVRRQRRLALHHLLRLVRRAAQDAPLLEEHVLRNGGVGHKEAVACHRQAQVLRAGVARKRRTLGWGRGGVGRARGSGGMPPAGAGPCRHREKEAGAYTHERTW
eukprot:361667-Chlamydomonas_euryale.AAC.2